MIRILRFVVQRNCQYDSFLDSQFIHLNLSICHLISLLYISYIRGSQPFSTVSRNFTTFYAASKSGGEKTESRFLKQKIQFIRNQIEFQISFVFFIKLYILNIFRGTIYFQNTVDTLTEFTKYIIKNH